MLFSSDLSVPTRIRMKFLCCSSAALPEPGWTSSISYGSPSLPPSELIFAPYATPLFRLELPTGRSTVLALLDCTAWAHPISGQTEKPLQIPRHNLGPLGWIQLLLTFSSPSFSKKRCFCSRACAEENCRGKKTKIIRFQIISFEFP